MNKALVKITVLTPWGYEKQEFDPRTCTCACLATAMRDFICTGGNQFACPCGMSEASRKLVEAAKGDAK